MIVATVLIGCGRSDRPVPTQADKRVAMIFGSVIIGAIVITIIALIFSK